MSLRVVTLLCVFSAGIANAGFLDMPDIIEAPELKRESLLRDLDIPSVRERDPDPGAGPRLNVSEFRVQGLVEYPELDITREEIIKRVEAIRFDMMDEGKRLASGYTLDELGELSDLIAEIEQETGEEHVTPVEVQRVVFLIREQRRRRGITLGMIETVADTITQYYRERGFILAKAYIPEQRVREGIVNLTLLLGALGEVDVTNNRRYRERTVQRTFDDMMGKPVTSARVEEKLFLLNDLPGLTARGYFEPGAQVGDTKLNIDIQSERRFDSNLRLDNHGGSQTGEYRAYMDFAWNNPTGFGDKLFVAGLYAAEPGSTTYGALRYAVKLFSPRLTVDVGVSSNAFELGRGNDEVGRGSLNLQGESLVYDAELSWNLLRSRKRNLFVTLSGDQIASDLESGSFDSLPSYLDKTVRNTALGLTFDVLQERKRRLHQGSIKVVSGQLIEGLEEGRGQDERFTLFQFDYTLLTFVRVPLFQAKSRLLTRVSGQYSGAKLTSLSQFGLGGPVRARGFSVNEFFADDAIYTGVEWIFETPRFLQFTWGKKKLSDAVQPFVFLDYAYGENAARINVESKETGQLGNLGLGAKLSAGALSGSVQIAFPMIGESSSSRQENELQVEQKVEFDDGVRAIFNLQYSF